MSEPRAASVPSVFVCRSVSPSPRVPLRFLLFMRPLNYYKLSPFEWHASTTGLRARRTRAARPTAMWATIAFIILEPFAMLMTVW